MSAVSERDRTDALDQVGRSFKGALAALRRLRGRETRRRGELGDAQYGLLFCLRDHDEMSSGELATAADLSPASVTELLDHLAGAGLVKRFRSNRDRRVVLTTLTDRGRDLVEARRARIEPRFHAKLADFKEEELRTASAVLDRLRELFDELADDPDQSI
jgi:DNA-binding MarR family transcriptional regulator